MQVAKEIHEGFKEVAQESNCESAGRMSPFLNSWKQIVAFLKQQVFRQFWTASRERYPRRNQGTLWARFASHEEIIEVARFIPQKCTRQRTAEEIVEVPGAQIHEHVQFDKVIPRGRSSEADCR